MRTLRFRRAARTSVLGTAALIAALSLTACQGSDPAPADGAAAPASPQLAGSSSAAPAPAPAPAADTGKVTTGDSGTPGSASGTAKDSGPAPQPAAAKQQTGKNSSASLATCADTNTDLTITSVPRPLNHMLLTVTNTGSKACNAYSYPFLKFGEAQSVPPVFEESKPQAVVTLAPGQSAYAGIRTSSADGSGTGGYSTEELAVGFQDANSGSTGRMVNVPLSKEVHVDSALTVTYWQTDMDDALMY